MIERPDVFADEYPPRRLLHRDPEVEQLMRWWARRQDTLLYGASGVGKTTLARHTLQRFAAESDADVASVRAMGRSTAGILRAILDALPGPNPGRTTPREDLALQLRERVDGPTVVVLDEGGDLPETAALERLADIDEVAACVICHDPDKWLAAADHAARRRFRSAALQVDRFSTGELVDILERRAAVGLRDGAVERTQLERIADGVAGVARNGIQVLRAAAERATREGHTAIRDDDIEGAYELAEARIRKRNILSLPFHHQLLYELIRTSDGISGADLHERYDAVADDVYRDRPSQPISKGDRRRKLRKLKGYDLIEHVGTGRASEYRAVDPDVIAPIDVEILERPP